MTLITNINEDLKNALRSNDQLKVSVLRLIKTALINLEKQAGNPSAGGPTDDDALAIINREIKQRQDTIAQLQSSRPEMVQADKKAIDLLKRYLPEQLSENELKKIIDQTIVRAGAKTPQDIGKVMGAVMGQTKGRADGNLVSKLVREKLAQ